MEYPADVGRNPPSPGSPASSHFPLAPVSGLVLLQREAARRDAVCRRGRCLTGCSEIDVEVLAGGFERGCVVGLGLQTLARLLVRDALGTDDTEQHQHQQRRRRRWREERPRVVVVTTLPTSALLPTLRAVLLDQAGLVCRDQTEASALASTCLEQIAISRVFDMDGLWEVLQEDLATRDVPVESPRVVLSNRPAQSTRDAARAETEIQSGSRPAEYRRHAAEIMDSEDEEVLPLSDDSSELSSPPPSSPEPPVSSLSVERDGSDTVGAAGPDAGEEPRPPSEQPQPPDRSISPTAEMILVTNMDSLLTSLFRSRDRESAHSFLGLTSSHLWHISRSDEYGCPLIMLLNGTNSAGRPTGPQPGQGDGAARAGPEDERSRPLDPSLRSIFNETHGDDAGARRGNNNKPAYGLVFTQLLDVHLLATLAPRARHDAEALYAGGGDTRAVRHAWVVEVLLDEPGVWAGRDGRRECREQRWGAVEVRGSRIVDAFPQDGKAN